MNRSPSNGKLSFLHISRLSPGVQVGLLPTDPHFELTRFQDPLALFIDKRKLIGRQLKLDGLFFTWG